MVRLSVSVLDAHDKTGVGDRMAEAAAAAAQDRFYSGVRESTAAQIMEAERRAAAPLVIAEAAP